MHLLGFIIILVLLIVLVPILTIGFWLLRKFYIIKQKLTGGNTASGNRSQQGTYSSSNGTYSSSNNNGRGGYNSSTHSSSSPQQGKIIPKDEGEYVDFEEV